MLSETFKSHNVSLEKRSDKSLILRSNDTLSNVADKTGEWLHQWAITAPDRNFLAERSGEGWRAETYQSTLQKVQALAAALAGRGLTEKTPILIMSGNSVDHGLLALAAQYIGVPTVPVAEQYSLIEGAHPRLIEIVNLIKPKLVFADDAKKYAKALALEEIKGLDILVSRNSNKNMLTIDELLAGDNSIDLSSIYNQVNCDTIAKILMTSGSTSSPKGVLTTHRMMCVNQAQISTALPLLTRRPPVIVDWLPWNHVFGGSHNFNMMLANGGSFYIDDGKPVRAKFGRTLENLSLVTGNLAFNVPLGFELLLEALQHDDALQQKFFTNLEMMFYAGASLPESIWEGFSSLSQKVTGKTPLLTSSWGMTETAPAALLQHEPTQRCGVIGVPLAGVEAKLIPDGDYRCELRVKGPNVMHGYFENLEKTKESFDDEGFLITGDAVKFVDIDNPQLGLKFDGRISEDFKLRSGTWVRAGMLRLKLLSVFAPLAVDVVVTGHDKMEIGLMIFPDSKALTDNNFDLSSKDGLLTCPRLLEKLSEILSDYNAQVSGSSNRIRRMLVLSEAPSISDAEITAKGNLNFGKILKRRASLLEYLYSDSEQYLIKN